MFMALLPQAFRQDERAVDARFRQQQNEFFTAQPCDPVDLVTGDLKADIGKFLEHDIADIMALGVVDKFEVIKIANGEGKGMFVAL